MAAFTRGEEFLSPDKTKMIKILDCSGPHVIYARYNYSPIDKRWIPIVDPDTGSFERALFDSDVAIIVQSLNPVYVAEIRRRKMYVENR